MKNSGRYCTVGSEHHQCYAAQVRGEVKNNKLNKGIQCERYRGCQD